MAEPKPSIFAYTNYRTYLEAMYHYYKAAERGFTYQVFSRRAGYTCPNFLQLVYQGKRNLTEVSGRRFSEALGHTPEECAYFLALVRFNQSKDSEEAARLYLELSTHQRYGRYHKLEKLEYDYYSHWYVPVIRELADLREFRADPVWIAATIQPHITPAQAKKALKILQKLGLLEHGPEGWRKSDLTVTTGPEVRSLGVKNFHRTMLRLAGEAIDTVPSAQRDISSLTMSLTWSQFERIKQRIAEFRKELMAMAESGERTDLLYQFNLQLYPLVAVAPQQREEEP